MKVRLSAKNRRLRLVADPKWTLMILITSGKLADSP
jgi:hypothetical protein